MNDFNLIWNFMNNFKYDKIIVFDTETTGLNFDKDEIIDYGSIVLSFDSFNNKYINCYDFLIKPIKIISLPDVIVNITGITNDKMSCEGKNINYFLEHLKNVYVNTNEKILIVGYNLNFDLNFLKNYLELKNFDYLDLYTVFRDIKGYPNKLCDAISYFKIIDAENSHRAFDDAFATLKVFEKIINVKKDLNYYINLFGYNPKYYYDLIKIPGIIYKPQYYNSSKNLYEVNYE
mgnify:CR=1 FL=1